MIKSRTANSIKCKVSSNEPGLYPVKVIPTNKEPADASVISVLEYDFKVSRISPRMGSVVGGTKVNISGSGFLCDKLKIEFGTHYTCMVQDCSSTLVHCTVERVSRTHMVRNTGLDGSLGKGFKFQPQHFETSPNDNVE